MLTKEPVVILDLIKYGLAAATAFGVSLSPDQATAILGLAGAILVVATAYTRSKVSPVSS